MLSKIILSAVECCLLLLCSLQGGVAQRNGDLRLTNGTLPNQYSGRLEIFDSSSREWGTICIDGFTLQSANTSCKQMGSAGVINFGVAVQLGYGAGSGRISLTQVQCGDDDSHILRCSSTALSTLTNLNCNHGQDVAVECTPSPAFQYEGGVRLVDGPYSSEGILEVFIFDAWYTFCTESLPIDAATAVCTQLGYNTYIGANSRSPISTGSPVWTTSPVCPFPIPCFSRCYTRPLTINDSAATCNSFIYITCDFDLSIRQSSPAGTSILCYLGPVFGPALQNGDIRLAGGNVKTAGRLEIYDSTSDNWGTICVEGFTQEAADTVCRQLGYSMAVTFGETNSMRYGVGVGPILLTEVKCDSNSNHILHCSSVAFSSLVSSCSHENDVAVVCGSTPAFQYEGGVRLVDGPYKSEGRLEMFVFGRWFAVCSVTFRITEATAVCQQLGYSNSIGSNVVTQMSSSSSWSAPFIQCNQSTTSCFSHCYIRPPSVSDVNTTCPFSTHVYVRCEIVLGSTTFGNATQCDLGPVPTSPPEPTRPPLSGGAKVGIGFAVGVPCIAMFFYIMHLHKTGKLKQMKADARQKWDNTRRRIRARLRFSRTAARPNTIEVVNEVTEPVVPNSAAADSSTAADMPQESASARPDTSDGGKYNSDRPPDYDTALTHRIPESDGYPEPSLVEKPPLPSYDSLQY